MSSKGQATREKLLDIAEQHFLSDGFLATSIEDLIKEAGITKGGFFYHFEGKNALASALLQRYQRDDALLFSGLFKRAEELTDDPLQQMLVFVKLLAETMGDMEGMHPGCLVASFTYETHHVNQQVRDITAAIVRDWRQLFKTQLDKINTAYNPISGTHSDDLADMLSTIIEGGIIVSRAVGDPAILMKQLLEYRRYVKLLYEQGGRKH
ncbi:TetR/AcrR family transcriptional regulator [Pseudomaricurvus alkylphenolicus]|jgi:AcrR family transcriptional regulator|uniref:TetR/AcrR family transcriptional regulator n=1 Tax=Pseudomaricurvus alkylphenolicus TaxID=1306991 RepID=UPI00141F93E6|nr:TetR/AcrR family transcriptional regulator [Pseudomaricurvus alkylphenolicus]NIB42281.1 TetR/AcrR family transcriptional regulator [Pseudomaricurvus alkylphenolicus]